MMDEMKAIYTLKCADCEGINFSILRSEEGTVAYCCTWCRLYFKLLHDGEVVLIMGHLHEDVLTPSA